MWQTWNPIAVRQANGVTLNLQTALAEYDAVNTPVILHELPWRKGESYIAYLDRQGKGSRVPHPANGEWPNIIPDVPPVAMPATSCTACAAGASRLGVPYICTFCTFALEGK